MKLVLVHQWSTDHVVFAQVIDVLQHFVRVGVVFLASRLGIVVTNVFQVENEHVDQHHQTIQSIKEDFVGNDVTMVTLKVFNHTNNGTDED